MNTTTDQIEKQILLHAPKSRVWRALTDSGEFGTWFRVKLESGFAAGQRATGKVTHPGYEHLKFEMVVERMDAERLFSFRWHPYAIEPGVDYSKEPTTLIEFRLEKAADGTNLTVIESGFDRIPLERRAKAFTANEGGWDMTVGLIEGYLVQAR